MDRATFWSTSALALALACTAAHAGRPLATDDAGTTPQGECQLEAWGEWQHERHGGVIAPACGVTSTLELSAAYARSNLPTGRDEQAGAGASGPTRTSPPMAGSSASRPASAGSATRPARAGAMPTAA